MEIKTLLQSFVVHNNSSKDYYRIMKILFFLLFICAFQLVAVETNGQNATISIRNSNISIREFIRDIESQTDYLIVFRNYDVDVNKVISFKKKTGKVSDFLNELSATTPINYTFDSNYITLSKKEIWANATDRKIIGTVTDERGEPIIGVNVVEKGTTNGVITDIEGKFAFSVAENAILQVSYIGYISQDIRIGSQTNITILLHEDLQVLDEVVVIGYGVQRKSDLTGAVASVKAEVIENQPVTRIDQALQGIIAGMQITSESGAPGSGTTIRIRGGNSINGSNEPLYVIDGIIGGGDLSMINPSDIQSIEVLKDASSTAIYGSRGANGVVLITTKMGKGTEGVRLNYHGYFGIQNAEKFLDVLNGPDYAQWRNEYERYFGREEIFDVNTVAHTDWQKQIYHTAPITEHNLSLSKGTQKGNYFLSVNYLNQEGIMHKTNFHRYQIRFNLEEEINKYFKMGAALSVAYTEKDNPVLNSSGMATLPVLPVYDEEGNIYSQDPLTGTKTNTPVAQKEYILGNTTSLRGLGNVYAIITPLKGLTVKTSFGFDLNRTKTNSYQSVNLPTRVYAKSGGYASVNTLFPITYQNENTINYQFELNKHRLDIMGGWTVQQYKQEFMNSSASGFTNDVTLYHAMETAEPTTKDIQTGESEWSMVSGLFRLNYVYDNKYLLTVSGRSDASSRLAPGNKWAFFPSAAVAWRLSEESFIKDMDMEALSDLKLRTSYGRSGSQAIAAYSTLDKLQSGETVMGEAQAIQFTKASVSNKKLGWEKTDQIDVGLNLGLFKGRLNVELDWYYKKTTDLLLYRELSYQTGFSSILENVGSVKNRGFEIAINSVNINAKDFQWTSVLTLSTNKSEVVDLAGKDFLENGLGSRLIVGEPIGTFFGTKYLGTWKEGEIPEGSKFLPGDPKMTDVNNDGAYTVADAMVIGNAEPKFYGGLGNTFRYKDFTLDLFFDFSYGNDVYDLYATNGYSGYNTNLYSSAKKRWSPQNPASNIPTAGSGFKYIYDTYAGKGGCSLFIQDGSFLRLKNLNIEYKLPSFTPGIRSFSVYGSVSNLFTLTKYDGYTPDVNYAGTHATRRGFDSNVYPQSRTFIVGVKMGF